MRGGGKIPPSISPSSCHYQDVPGRSRNCSYRLLLIEGPPSIALGVFGWLFLADSPETAWYLSPSQRKSLIRRSARDEREASTPSAGTLHRSDVVAAFKDWKVWAFSVLNFLADIQIFSYAYFLPTIIKAINPAWSTVYVQALTIPCFIWAAIAFFAVAYASDRLQHRAVFGILACLVSIIGHVMLIAGHNVAVQYTGCFFIATGIYVVSGIAIVWMPTNLPRYGKRSTAVGMQLMIGTSAGIPAPYVSHFPYSSSRFLRLTCESFIPPVIHRDM